MRRKNIKNRSTIIHSIYNNDNYLLFTIHYLSPYHNIPDLHNHKSKTEIFNVTVIVITFSFMAIEDAQTMRAVSILCLFTLKE